MQKHNRVSAKFRDSKSINEKIEILERIGVISLNFNNVHSLFVLEEDSIIAQIDSLTGKYAATVDLTAIA